MPSWQPVSLTIGKLGQHLDPYSSPIRRGEVLHEVKISQRCNTYQAIIDWEEISLANVYKWNPAIGINCQSLWVGYYVCAAVCSALLRKDHIK